VNQLDLQQYSQFNFGTKWDIIRHDFRDVGSSFQLNAFLQLYYTPLGRTDIHSTTDTAAGKTIQTNTPVLVKSDMTSGLYGLELSFEKRIFHNVGTTLYFRAYHIGMLKGNLAMDDGYSVRDSGILSTDRLTYYPREFKNICYSPSFDIFFYGKDDNAFYIRGAYFSSFFNSYRNSFFQFQLGYSLDVNQLVKKQ
jgi:hypothetical protein